MAPGHQPLVTLSLPTSELANPLENTSMQVHRLYHAARALPKRTPQETLGLIRPPSANLTSDNDQENPANSGYVLTLSFLAEHRAAPSVKSAPRLCVPSPRSGETSVASSANWHPPNKVTPSATT